MKLYEDLQNVRERNIQIDNKLKLGISDFLKKKYENSLSDITSKSMRDNLISQGYKKKDFRIVNR